TARGRSANRRRRSGSRAGSALAAPTIERAIAFRESGPLMITLRARRRAHPSATADDHVLAALVAPTSHGAVGTVAAHFHVLAAFFAQTVRRARGRLATPHLGLFAAAA